jgi:glycogen operon protein
VTYNDKHNEANGEQNRDGSNDDHSWNCGVEGPTDDAGINLLRDRQSRNLLATLLLSQGTPMMLAGDEMGRTQGGNNNAYCQDNEISWIDWTLESKSETLTAFVKQLCALRHRYPILRRNRFLTGDYDEELEVKDVTWIQSDGGEMQAAHWTAQTRCFGMLIDGRARPTGVRQRGSEATLLILMNAHHEAVPFTLPDIPGGGSWKILFDTNVPQAEPAFEGIAGDTYEIASRSLALFVRKD